MNECDHNVFILLSKIQPIKPCMLDHKKIEYEKLRCT